MADLEGLDKLYTVCPFCFEPLHAVDFTHPGNWICPICNTPDPEWFFMLNCASCGFGHRIIECPHCKEDFDSMRMMLDFEIRYMDYIRIEKYDGHQSVYNLGDLNCIFGINIDDETQQTFISLCSNVTFNFPGYPGQIRTFKIYNFQSDKSVEGKFWICAYLYDREDIDSKDDVGQVVLVLTPEEKMRVRSVVDVSRKFIFKNERQKRKSDQSEITSETESACIEKIDQLSSFIQTHKLEAEDVISKGKLLAQDCLRSTFDSLSNTFGSNGQPSEQLGASVSNLAMHIVQLNMTDKDMPWRGQDLDDLGKKTAQRLNGHISTEYYNSAVHLGQSEKHKVARHRYKKAILFESEPPLSVWIHYNWALTIHRINNNFQELDPNKSYETIAEYCEMVAHFDEIIRQYALITDDEYKENLQRFDAEAKQAVQDAIDMDSAVIRYSDAHDGQLVMMPYKEGEEPLLLKATWTEYDLAGEEQRKMTDDEKRSIEYSQKGLEYLEKRMLDKAIGELRKALKHNPLNIDALGNLGTALQWKGRFADAIETFKKALEMELPEEAKGTINYNLGNAYKEQKKYEEAIPFYLKAIEINPESDDRHFNLGQCYLALMRFDEAIAAYEAALKINPSHENAKKSLDAAKIVRDSDMAEELGREADASGKEQVDDNGHEMPDEAATHVVADQRSTGKRNALIAVVAVLLLVFGFIVLQNRNVKQDNSLNKTFQESSPQRIGHITTNVNLRTGPGVENASIGVLNENIRTVFIGSKKAKNGVKWYQIKIANGPLKGKTGYVNYKYLEVSTEK